MYVCFIYFPHISFPYVLFLIAQSQSDLGYKMNWNKGPMIVTICEWIIIGVITSNRILTSSYLTYFQTATSLQKDFTHNIFLPFCLSFVFYWKTRTSFSFLRIFFFRRKKILSINFDTVSGQVSMLGAISTAIFNRLMFSLGTGGTLAAYSYLLLCVVNLKEKNRLPAVSRPLFREFSHKNNLHFVHYDSFVLACQAVRQARSRSCTFHIIVIRTQNKYKIRYIKQNKNASKL